MKVRAKKKKAVFSNDEEVSRLGRELREAHSTIKSLQKKLARHDKRYTHPKEKEVEEKKQAVATKDCPGCSRADLEEIVLAGRLFKRCPICGYRTKAVKL